jgi:hypothetical protein
VIVVVHGDTSDEPDERFFLNLSNPARPWRSQGIATIRNDEARL